MFRERAMVVFFREGAMVFFLEKGQWWFLCLSQDDSSTYIYSNSVMVEETTTQYLHFYATVKILSHS